MTGPRLRRCRFSVVVLPALLAACSSSTKADRSDASRGEVTRSPDDAQADWRPLAQGGAGAGGSRVDLPGVAGSAGAPMDVTPAETGAMGGSAADAATPDVAIPIDIREATAEAGEAGPADDIDSPITIACPPGSTPCGGTCVDTTVDPDHCSACGMACRGGKTCAGGTCVCPTGQVDCSGRCADLKSDPNNCLACGALCTGGKVCDPVNGCECPGVRTECQGICVDTMASPLDCGGCGITCAAGLVCTLGKCGCTAGQTACEPGLCVDTATSMKHCGTCGQACGTGQVCAGGHCVCDAGKTDCQDGTCADTQSDPTNCGTCGNACDANRVCNAGVCSTQCASGFTNCDGACVDLETDALHCGTCPNRCTAGSTCKAGTCTCPAGLSECGGTCVSLQSDSKNCSTCGHFCPNGSFCEAATCKCTPGYDVCGAGCVDLLWNKDHCGNCTTACSGGRMCSEGKCSCPPPQVDCNGACVSLQSDDANCGTCGHACSVGSCVSGECACPPYQSACNGQCIPTANDPNNCGGCGVACASNQVCIANACTGSCYGGLTACDGTCVDLASDRNHCGSCTNVCAAGQGCAGGSCVTGVPVGPDPAKCVGGGPMIMLTTDGITQQCAGATAATTFPWAICACDSFTGKGSQIFDAFDSTRAPYTPDGLGAGVGVNSAYSGGSSMSCTGTLWSYQSIDPGTAVIRQELHVGAALGGNVTVSGTGYVVSPNDRGSFAGDLYTATCPAAGYSVGGTCHANPALAVPPPCQRCDGGSQVPVQGYVAYYAQAAHNDNAAIGLSPSVLSSGSAAAVIDLPCGYYYLDRIVAETSVTVAVRGNTALFIGGGIDVKGTLVLALDASSRLDVFVGGAIYADGTLTMGSAAYPANLRLYVGGACKSTGAACAQKADCCSAICTGGVCSGTSLLPGDPPWSLYMKAASNIAANIYTPNGEMYAGASFAMYGAIFAGDYKANGSTIIHYDRATVDQGKACPPGSGCQSCLDCNNQACVNGTCGSCTTDSQCCPPLVCMNGRCGIGS